MKCTSMDCGMTGTVRGTYYCHDETFENVVYCVSCATLLMEYGEFSPAAAVPNAEAQVERIRALARRLDSRGILFNGPMIRELIEKTLDG